VTDDSLIVGQRTGHYPALCGHRLSAAALATPLGRPCAACIAVSAAQPQVTTRAPGSPLPALSARVVAAATTAPPAQYRQRHGRLMTAMPGALLTGTDLYHWIGLRRVFDGEVARLDSCWRDHGHVVPGYVADVLNELLRRGLVMLADPLPSSQLCAAPYYPTNDLRSLGSSHLCQVFRRPGRCGRGWRRRRRGG
jgi:hypothetical protein